MKNLFILTLSIFLLAGCSTDKPQTNEEANTDELGKIEQTDNTKAIREMENSEDKTKDGTQAVGSCNAVAENSTCVEYYGDFWTEPQMEIMCEGSGEFSTDPCPNDMAGGCNTGTETMADMVVWMYLTSDGEITSQSLKYAKMACDANASSKWITTK